MVEGLKVEGRNNLFAIFPIGATMQDSGKRKRGLSGYSKIYCGVSYNNLYIKEFVFYSS